MTDSTTMRPELPKPYIYYVEFYVALTFSDGDEAYFHYQTDATKPVTEDFMANLLAATWEYQADSDPKNTVVAARYVTRTDWEAATMETVPVNLMDELRPEKA